MKRVLIFSIFILIYSAGHAQDNVTMNDGYQVFKYPNGAVSSEGPVRNGKPDVSGKATM